MLRVRSIVSALFSCGLLVLAGLTSGCSSTESATDSAVVPMDDRGVIDVGPAPDGSPPPPGGWKAVSTGGAHTCAIDVDDLLWCWGSNSNGQLGDGTAVSRSRPALVKDLGPVTSVDADWVHTCAATRDGLAFCWGENDGMQLGDPLAESTKPFCREGGCPEPVQVVDLSAVAAVGIGARHSCAVIVSGTAWCWGFNELGQLGDGKLPFDSARPSQVVGLTTAVAISASPWHSCARTAEGKALCWGDNADGNVGVESPSEVSTPVEVPGVGSVTAISAGEFHSCLVAAGSVYCFGGNRAGQLGTGSTEGGATPTVVSGPTGVQAVAAGLDHSCAVDAAGEVWCWGSNGVDSNQDGQPETVNGKLGQPETVESLRIAAKVSGLSGATAVTVGDQHSCAVTAAGRLWCWGSNADGQLGLQAPAYSGVPVEVVAPK